MARRRPKKVKIKWVGVTPQNPRGTSTRPRVGRLRWTCLRCHETGAPHDIARRACSRCGAGEHIKKIRR